MPRLNKWDSQHIRNMLSYQAMIEEVYKAAAREAAAIGVSIHEFNADRLFSFADYPSTTRRIKTLLESLRLGLQTVVVNGVRSEWTLANNKNNELCRQVFGDNAEKLPQAAYRKYFSSNPEALEAFTKRKTAGLRLSDRVWNYTNQFKEEIELGLDVGIRSGLSAEEMSRQLRMYLKYPDKLFRRIKDEHGNLQLSKRAAAFHPGRGVYRSSYKNARRLAATETNIAYRTADYERWQNLDFVVGIEILLSNNHTCLGADGKPHPFHDICDELAGRYPKDFKFVGWHPHCRCRCIPILMTEEELMEGNRRIMRGEEPTTESVNQVLGNVAPKELSMEQFERMASAMNISSKERDILYNSDDLYIDSSWSRVINSELAKGKIGKIVPKDFMDDPGSFQQVKTLDAVIERNHLSKDLLVYRKVSEHWLNREGYDFSVGSIVNEYGFTSTSAVKGANVIRKSKNVRLEIIARKGTNAYVTENTDESEIIFPRNSKFKVLSVSNGEEGKIIRLELLPEKGQVSDGLEKLNYWIDDNRERAKGWATMPYFVRDNPNYVTNFRVDTYSATERKFTRAYHTSPAMKQSLATYLQKKYPDMPNTEKAALCDYTRGDVSDFRHLNKELMDDRLSEFNVAFSDLLSNALSKLPTEEATVYRTIRLNRTSLESWKRQAEKQAETTFQGFTSTSDSLETVQDMITKKAARKKKNETDVLLVIKGKTGHRIEDFSKFHEQRELLFDKGMRLKYERLTETNGQIVFWMTEI